MVALPDHGTAACNGVSYPTDLVLVIRLRSTYFWIYQELKELGRLASVSAGHDDHSLAESHLEWQRYCGVQMSQWSIHSISLCPALSRIELLVSRAYVMRMR